MTPIHVCLCESGGLALARHRSLHPPSSAAADDGAGRVEGRAEMKEYHGNSS